MPIDAQRLLCRFEIWRSLRPDSLAVALRRLLGVAGPVAMEIERTRATAGVPVDATLIRPSMGDSAEHIIQIVLRPAARVQPDSPLTLAEAYRNYIDDLTRAWTASTREA